MLEYFVATQKNILDKYLIACRNDYTIKFEEIEERKCKIIYRIILLKYKFRRKKMEKIETRRKNEKLFMWMISIRRDFELFKFSSSYIFADTEFSSTGANF